MTQSGYDTTTGALRNDIWGLLHQSFGSRRNNWYFVPMTAHPKPVFVQSGGRWLIRENPSFFRGASRASLSITAHALRVLAICKQNHASSRRSRRLFLANRRHLTADLGVDYWGKRSRQSVAWMSFWAGFVDKSARHTAEADQMGRGIACHVAGRHAVCSLSSCARQRNSAGGVGRTAAAHLAQPPLVPEKAVDQSPRDGPKHGVPQALGAYVVHLTQCCGRAAERESNGGIVANPQFLDLPTSPSLTVSHVERKWKSAGNRGLAVSGHATVAGGFLRCPSGSAPGRQVASQRTWTTRGDTSAVDTESGDLAGALPFQVAPFVPWTPANSFPPIPFQGAHAICKQRTLFAARPIRSLDTNPENHPTNPLVSFSPFPRPH
jgi:hypothetical protein